MISLSIDGPVAVITMCRAPVNAINEEWLAQLDASLDRIENSADISVVRFRSSERTFSAGADLGLMSSRFETADGRKLMIAFVRRMQEVYARIERLAAVTIAEIAGAAMGGGLELALSCDLRVISQDARIGLPEARLGLLPGAGGTQRLTLLCGGGVARRIILGAEIVDGITAEKLGIAQWCVPGDDITDFTAELAGKVAASTGQALAQCKRCIAAAGDETQNGFELELSGTLDLLATPQTQDRVRQFLQGSGNSRAS